MKIIATLSALALVAALTGCTAATAEPTKAETKAETKTVTPDACVEALDVAEGIIDLLSDALILGGDAMEAAASWDIDALDDLTAQLAEITPQIEDSSDDYWAAANECRGGESA